MEIIIYKILDNDYFHVYSLIGMKAGELNFG